MSSLVIIENILQAVVAGLLIGSVYGLMCVGLGLIFGLMRVINFAQGEFLMLGMYVTFYFFHPCSASPSFFEDFFSWSRGIFEGFFSINLGIG